MTKHPAATATDPLAVIGEKIENASSSLNNAAVNASASAKAAAPK